jgi:hypothetical protein
MTVLQTRSVATMDVASRLVAGTHRWLDWIGHLARRRATIYIITIVVGVYGVLQRCSGLRRSLWLDEAWVANSVSAPSLKGMFYYDTWVQSSPPLFLLLVRLAVAPFGPSNTAFRAVPFFMGILAILSMLLFAARTLSRQYALLAWTLLVLSPFAIDYSKELKQYSSELAVSATVLLITSLYIENATARRFWLLVGTVFVGLLVGYAVAFIVPGLVFILCMTPIECRARSTVMAFPKRFARAFILTVVGGGTLIGEYFLFVVPNSSAALRSGLLDKNRRIDSVHFVVFDGYKLVRELPLNHLLRGQNLILGIVGVIVTLGVILASLRFQKGRRRWLVFQVFCLSPCLLLVIADRSSHYPFTERTSLFALPFLIFLVVSSLQLAYLFVLQRGRSWVRPIADVMLLCVIAITIHAGYRTHLDVPKEDAGGAVSFLRAHVQSSDFLWVHASSLEAFRLYTRMIRWQNAPAHYGHTGWPCCTPGIDNPWYTFGELLVRSDFGRALPVGFRGRVWLLYTMRADHWRGHPNEPQFMRTILRERGCVEMPTPAFTNMGVDSFDCGEQARMSFVR